MESLSLLMSAIVAIMNPYHLSILFGAVFVGMIVAVLPGIGPTTALAILIPVTFLVEPAAALMIFGALYYSAMFGATISAILLNIPGDSGVALSAVEGHPMAKRGQAGVALGLSAICSFIGATVSATAFTFLGPAIALWALSFGPPEYFAIAMLGLVLAGGLTGKDWLKGYSMIFLGLVIGFVGMDMIDGEQRYTFGVLGLYDGIPWLPVAIGLFGIAEVLLNLERRGQLEFINAKITLRNIWPSLRDWAESAWSIVRGTIQGFFVGMLPGAGAAVATFIAYGTEYRLSRRKERFGNGSIEGLAAVEAANNSVVGGAFIPTFALGIPGSPFMAVMLGGMLLHGLTPGPTLFQQTDVIWPFIASVYVGAVILLLINLFMIPTFIYIIRVSQRFLNPLIVMLCILGVFSVRGQMFDVWLMLMFGFVGYVLRKLDYPVAPFILAIILSPIAERALRQSLMMSRGSLDIFINRPVSAMAFAVVLLFLVGPIITGLWRRFRLSGGKGET
ncbi:MAG: tripartite tricarboxylate transporter permease [Salinarimonadaceae bacterium]|nr:MAG: tripartite tricarboxylate transporter permease [Salinarimonadaceae bacterium]